MEAKRFFAAPSLELGREGTQARPDENNIFGSTLVVTENGKPRACATIGLRSNPNPNPNRTPNPSPNPNSR